MQLLSPTVAVLPCAGGRGSRQPQRSSPCGG